MNISYKPTALKVVISICFWLATAFLYYVNTVRTEITKAQQYGLLWQGVGLGLVVAIIYYLIHSWRQKKGKDK